MCRVRGIGVADIASTSTSSRSCRSSSFWATPKRCSSSTTTSPRLPGTTSRESTRWVPIRMSTVPCRKSASTRFVSAGGRNRETVSTRTGKSRKRSLKVAPCCWASIVVGHQHQHLAAARHRLQGRSHRHLGLAEADVAADQPVHRLLGLHVVGDGLDRALLVVGLLVRERLLQPRRPLVVAAGTAVAVTAWRRAYSASSSPASSRTATRARAFRLCQALPPSLASAGAEPSAPM